MNLDFILFVTIEIHLRSYFDQYKGKDCFVNILSSSKYYYHKNQLEIIHYNPKIFGFNLNCQHHSLDLLHRILMHFENIIVFNYYLFSLRL